MHRFSRSTLISLALLGGGGAGAAPVYTADGNLVPPADYREWIYMSSGLDMAYTEGAAADHSMFDNVFVDPASWAEFKKTGHWRRGPCSR